MRTEMGSALSKAGFNVKQGDAGEFFDSTDLYNTCLISDTEINNLNKCVNMGRELLASSFSHDYKIFKQAAFINGPNVLCKAFRYVFGEGFVDVYASALKKPYMSIIMSQEDLIIKDAKQYANDINKALTMAWNEAKKVNVDNRCFEGFKYKLFPDGVLHE